MLSFARRLVSQARPFTSSAFLQHNAAPAPKTSPLEELSEGEQHIFRKLTNKFAPSELQVQDVSGGCGTFYAIVIASPTFKGLPIVKQHKLVTETLKSEIEGIHGLQIKTIPQ